MDCISVRPQGSFLWQLSFKILRYPCKILSMCRCMLFEDFLKAMYTFPSQVSIPECRLLTASKWKLKEAISQKILSLSVLHADLGIVVSLIGRKFFIASGVSPLPFSLIHGYSAPSLMKRKKQGL